MVPSNNNNKVINNNYANYGAKPEYGLQKPNILNSNNSNSKGSGQNVPIVRSDPKSGANPVIKPSNNYHYGGGNQQNNNNNRFLAAVKPSSGAQGGQKIVLKR